jgi:ureidoglycolate lyase
MEVTVTESRKIEILELTKEAYEPFGWVLGEAPISKSPDLFYDGSGAIFWHEHNFAVGEAGVVEFLWVYYKRKGFSLVSLESHRLTEQAIFPVAGLPLVQVVAPPPEDPLAPDIVPELDKMTAFLVSGSQGVCMKRGCWHTQFALFDMTTCLMVTRESTTSDILIDRYACQSLHETVVVDIANLADEVYELVL